MLADVFPSSAHVQTQGLDTADDMQIWEHAAKEDFAIVSKDVDYNHLSVLRGSPPKVIWLLLGNCTTEQVEAAIRAKSEEIVAFEKDTTIGTLIVR